MDLRNELVAHPDLILLDLKVDSREAALRAIHAKLTTHPAVRDAAQFLRDLLERVMAASVCVAPSVALPHARTTAVDKLVLAVARVAEPGVGFDREHPAVRLIFLIGVPRADVDAYLLLVGRITRLLRTEGAQQALLAARDEAEFRAVLARFSTP